MAAETQDNQLGRAEMNIVAPSKQLSSPSSFTRLRRVASINLRFAFSCKFGHSNQQTVGEEEGTNLDLFDFDFDFDPPTTCGSFSQSFLSFSSFKTPRRRSTLVANHDHSRRPETVILRLD